MSPPHGGRALALQIPMSELDFGLNAGLVEELFGRYLDNPDSVDASWRSYFDERTGADARRRAAFAKPGGNGHHAGANGAAAGQELTRALERAFDASVVASPTDDEQALLARAAVQARVFQLLNAYRVRGHFYAAINPLGDTPHSHTELALENFNLSEADLDKPFPKVDLAGPESMTLREIVERLEETYCRSVGVEFTHIEDPVARKWLRERMESTKNRLAMSREQQLRVLTKLTEAEAFEQFIHGSYGAGTKRFSLEGGEAMIPFLDLLIERAGEHQVDEVVLGMAHRGRLNVLVNILGKNLREIFAAFEDVDGEANLGRGDVKYHLGYSSDRVTEAGQKVHLTLCFNPSHLEFVNPVVEGRVRAKQDRRSGRKGALARPSEEQMRRVMPLLIHGDAAFIGQGIVPETLNLIGLEGYATGGTIHLIINNQIGSRPTRATLAAPSTRVTSPACSSAPSST